MLKMLRSFMSPAVSWRQSPAFRRDFRHQLGLGIAQAIYTSIASIVLLQSLGGEPFLVAYLQAGIMAGLLASPFYVRLLHRQTPAKAYATPHLAAWVCFGIAGLVSDAHWFTTMIFAGSVLFSISTPFQTVLYEVIYQKSIRGKLVSFAKQWQMFLMMAASWVLGSSLEHDSESYRLLLPIAACLGILSALGTRRIVCQIPTDPKTSFSLRAALSLLRHDRNFTWFMLLQFGLGLSNLAGVAALQVYINGSQYLAATPQQAALLTGVIPPLFMFFSFQIWGRIFDRVNIVTYRALASLTMAIGFVLYPLKQSLAAAFAGAIIWGIGRSGGQLAWSIGVLSFARHGQAATYMGLHTFLTGIRGVLAPFIGVWCLSSGLPAQHLCWLIAGAIAATAMLNLVLVKNPEYLEDP